MSEHRLDKAIIERPRRGYLKTPQGAKKYQQTFDDEFSGYEPKCRFKTKYFSDNLNPLQRFLLSRVGKPWNEVYSELSRRFDKRTLTGYHLFSHVETLVAQHVEIVEDLPYTTPRSKYGRQYPLGYVRDNLYVHPETGILSVAKKQKTPIEKREDILELDRDRQYRKIDEIWYLVTFAECPYPRYSSNRKVFKVFDVLLGKKLDYWTLSRQYNRTTYAVHKRHCTKKEIKQIVKILKS